MLDVSKVKENTLVSITVKPVNKGKKDESFKIYTGIVRSRTSKYITFKKASVSQFYPKTGAVNQFSVRKKGKNMLPKDFSITIDNIKSIKY